jgi:O-antigen ligase
LIYFIRGTVLPWFLPLPVVAWAAINCLILFCALGIGVAGGGRWRWWWIIILFVFGLGIFQAEQPMAAGLRWFGLALLIPAVGPVILNPAAMEVRAAAWRFSTNGMVALTGIFFLWYVFHLPSFGVGFSAFMYQCMLLAPIAGMGILIALARAIHGRSWRWGLFAILGLVPLLAAGSRVAALATIAGLCFLLIRRKPVLGLAMLALCSSLVYAFITHGGNIADAPESITGAMASKGDLNSRADMWESRLSDFESSPIIGIGIGMGSGAGGIKEGSGSIQIEPGSSYLAVLAMTGLLGAVSFCLALGFLMSKLLVSRQRAGLDKDILYLVGIYLAVHGVAEGWILSFGGPLCFLFWLWLGNVGDFALQPARAKVKRRVSAPPRFARPIGPAPTAPSC